MSEIHCESLCYTEATKARLLCLSHNVLQFGPDELVFLSILPQEAYESFKPLAKGC